MNGGDDANGSLILTGECDAERRRHGGADDRNRRRQRVYRRQGETLTNSDVIEGTGVIGNGSLTLTSSGTIDADVGGPGP